MTRDICPQGRSPAAQFACEIAQSFLRTQHTPTWSKEGHKALVEAPGVRAVNVYVSIVELGRPTVLLAGSLEVKAHTLQVNLVDLVEFGDVFLGLFGALDRSWVLLTHTAWIQQSAVYPPTRLEESCTVVVG